MSYFADLYGRAVAAAEGTSELKGFMRELSPAAQMAVGAKYAAMVVVPVALFSMAFLFLWIKLNVEEPKTKEKVE